MRRSSFACCMKIWACSGRSGPMASGDYDRQRFDEHLDRYLRADKRPDYHQRPINPSTGLLYRRGLDDRAGAAGL